MDTNVLMSERNNGQSAETNEGLDVVDVNMNTSEHVRIYLITY